MSTIVVTQKNNQVCIAADSLTSFGDTKLPAAYDKYHNKIQKIGDSYIGIVGSAAHCIVIEDVFQKELLSLDFDSRHAIFNTFLKLHPILKEHYFLNAKGDDEDPYETTHIDAVIANKNGIFAVYGLRDVNQFDRFWSVGSGSSYALGAMHAAYDLVDTAQELALCGANAGAEFDNASDRPITYEALESSN